MILPSIAGCSACGNNHKSVPFVEVFGKPWTHQAVCPVNGKDILIIFDAPEDPITEEDGKWEGEEIQGDAYNEAGYDD